MYIKVKIFAKDGLSNIGLSKIQLLDDNNSPISLTMSMLVSHTFNTNALDGYLLSWMNNVVPVSIPYQTSSSAEFLLSVPDNSKNEYTFQFFNWINDVGLVQRVEISYSLNGVTFYPSKSQTLDLNINSLTKVDFKTAKANEAMMIIQNPTTNQIYSLDDKTLIALPDASTKNMILHGIKEGKEIRLDEPFDKIKFVNDESDVLGEGKTFNHTIDLSKWKTKKITL